MRSWRYTSSSSSGGSSLNGASKYRPRQSSALSRSPSSSNLTMSPFLNGFDSEIVSVGTSSTPLTSRAGAKSPLGVPAKTRLPDAKITSGLSVRGCTMTSPRIPCALRISPTIAYSGPGIGELPGLGAGGGFVRFFADWNSFGFALDAEPLLVAPSENASSPKERPYSIGRLGAEVEPVVGSRFVDLERTLTLPGGVLADDLDELPIARTLRVRDENAIERRIFPPNAAETNLYHLVLLP